MAAALAIRMPKFGMTMKEGTVLEWTVALGARVERGEVVAMVETEKAEVELESPEGGFLRHIYVEPGCTVACGTLLAALTETAEETFDAEAFAAAAQHAAAEDSAHASPERPSSPASDADAVSARVPLRSGTAADPGGATSQDPQKPRAQPPVAPAARALARKLGVDTGQVRGTGPGGRVTRSDVQAHAQAREALHPVADGVALEILSQGEGDPVLLLPGFGVDASAYARQVPVLAERYRVLGMNPRGVGASDAPADGGYDPVTMAADAAAVLDEPTHVIGASMGAAAALELATRNPDRVRSLTLITPALCANARLRSVLRAWCVLVATDAALAATALLPWLFSEATLGDERARDRVCRGLQAILSRTPAEVLERYAEGLEKWAAGRGELAPVKAPTLVLIAQDDCMLPDPDEQIRALSPATVVRVEGAGHALALEAPEPVNRAILDHLGAR